MRATMIIGAPLLPALVLTACGSYYESDEAPVDYEAINEVALGPAAAITPEILTSDDIRQHDLFGAGCSVVQRGGEGLLFIASRDAAHFLLSGELITLAPHPGSDDLPHGIARHYDGKTYSAELEIDTSTKLEEGPEASGYDGALTIRDPHERPVYEFRGRVECGA